MTHSIETRTTGTAPTVLGLPPGSNALVKLAHPDDEFMVGGLLDQFQRYDITTHAVIASDGEASDRGDPEALRNFQRRHEAAKALGKYGIRMEHQYFMGLPDGDLSAPEHMDAMSNQVGRLLAEHSIRTVVTLGRFGYDSHDDHISTHLAARKAAAGYSEANPHIRLYGLAHNETDVQVPADPAAKLRRLALHRSQFDIDLSDPEYQPEPGTVEQPGIRLSETSRGYLARYYLNMSVERYEGYPLN